MTCNVHQPATGGRGCARSVALAVSGRGRGCFALGRRRAERHSPDRRIAHPATSFAPASRSGSSRAGTPIGAIPATPACRRASISRDHRTSNRSTCCGRRRKRLPEGGMTAIGYDRDVILPLRIVPQDPAKPVVLRLKLDYAVCEKLCVPAEAKAELALAGGSSALGTDAGRGRGARAEEGRARRGGDARHPLRPARRRRGPAARRRRRRGADGVRSTCSPKARRRSGRCRCRRAGGAPQSGLRRFAFELDGAPPGAQYQGAPVTLTAVAGDDAIEVTTRLD